MKKGILVMMAFALLFTLSFGQTADAAKRGGGGIKSPKQSFTQTPKKADGASQSTSGTKSPSTTAGATKPGFFSGGGLMKGMMIGGLAGLMFGGMFAGMGAMGNILGMMINLIAIAALVMLIVAAFKYIRRKRTPDTRGPY